MTLCRHNTQTDKSSDKLVICLCSLFKHSTALSILIGQLAIFALFSASVAETNSSPSCSVAALSGGPLSLSLSHCNGAANGDNANMLDINDIRDISSNSRDTKVQQKAAKSALMRQMQS